MNTGLSTDWKPIKYRTNRTKRKRGPNGRLALALTFGLVVASMLCLRADALAGRIPAGEAQPEREGSGGSSEREARKAGWSIVVGAVVLEETPGEAERLAEEALARVRTKGRLTDAKMERRGRSLVIFYGDYEGPESDKAVEDLERIRGIEVEGATPYARAYLAPPPDEAMKGSIAEYDLRNVRQGGGLLSRGLGAGAGGKSRLVYTLQVGAYGRADGGALKPDELAEARAAAEKAAVQLRREGELSFYYHAATLSCVTVGLFGADELASKDPRATPGETVDTPELAMLRKLHPHNLLNGQGVVIKRVEASGKARTAEKAKALQPSFLVEVPK